MRTAPAALSALPTLALALALLAAPAQADANANLAADAGNDVYNGVVGVELDFTAAGSTTDAGHFIQSYSWSFGDGDSATGQTVAHTYDGDATYSVTLTITDNHGNTDSDTVSAVIADTDAIAPGIAEPEDGWNQAGAVGDPVVVDAALTDNVAVDAATLHYFVDSDNDEDLSDEADSTLAMDNTEGDTWRATIPGAAVTAPVVGYYVEATDAADNTARYPASGEDDPDAGIEDGLILVSFGLSISGASSGTVEFEDAATIPVEATIAPAADVESAIVRWRAAGQESYTAQAMENECGTLWVASVPSTAFLDGDTLYFYVEVTDTDGGIQRDPETDYIATPNEVTLDLVANAAAPDCGTEEDGGGGGGGGGSRDKDSPLDLSDPIDVPTEEEDDGTPADDDALPDQAAAIAQAVATANQALAASLRVSHGSGGNHLSWSPQSGAAGYQVWASDSPWRLVATLDDGGAVEFSDPSGTATTLYLVTAWFRDPAGDPVGLLEDINEQDVPGIADPEGEAQSPPSSSSSRKRGPGLSLAAAAAAVAVAALLASRRGPVRP